MALQRSVAALRAPVSNLWLVPVGLGLGVLLRRTRLLPEDAPRAFNGWVLYVALPALVLAKLSGVSLAGAAVPASMAWLQLGLVVGAVQALGALAGWDRPTRAALMLTAGLGNTSFVGYPLIEALVGPEGLPTAILADQLGSFLALATAGTAIAAWGRGDTASVRSRLAQVVRFPALWALGLALAGPALPDAVLGLAERLGATLTPLALASVGLQLDLAGPRPDGRALGAGLALKLAVAPAVLLGLYLALGVRHDQVLEVTVLQAAMAPMITAAILAADHGLAPALANRMVAVGIPLSFVTVPLWSAFIGGW